MPGKPRTRRPSSNGSEPISASKCGYENGTEEKAPKFSYHEEAQRFTKSFCDLSRLFHDNKKAGEESSPAFFERLAATYSRRTYRTTTIGKAMFDGRVRNGNGSDHSFMATKVKRET